MTQPPPATVPDRRIGTTRIRTSPRNAIVDRHAITGDDLDAARELGKVQVQPGDIVLLERCGYNYALKPPTKSFEGVSRPASTQVLGGQMSTDESEVATTPPALSLKERR